MNYTTKKYNLPQIPLIKNYYSDTANPEHDALLKAMEPGAKLTDADENILKEAIDFYSLVFESLKAIPLSSLSLDEASDLIEYLKYVFTFSLPIGNDLHIERIHRVTVVEENFLEKGKIRHPKYLTYPPLKVIKRLNRYGRGNSIITTGLYAAFSENVAIRETKPIAGSKIVISQWVPVSNLPFNSYPITNSDVDNDEVRKATLAFKKKRSELHPSVAKIMDLHIGFLASEFVKDCPMTNPHRLEYFFSAYFAEQTLQKIPPEIGMPNFDLVIYPSVAFGHKEPNILMDPISVDTKLKVVYATEYLVEETYYYKDDGVPTKLKFIRDATWFEKDQIIWEDD